MKSSACVGLALRFCRVVCTSRLVAQEVLTDSGPPAPVAPWTRMGNPSLRFDADFVVHGESELLLATEVIFRRLDRYVAEEELDLVEVAASQMTETRTCAPKMPHAAFSPLYRIQDYAE